MHNAGMQDTREFEKAKAAGELLANPLRTVMRQDAVTIGRMLLVINLNNVSIDSICQLGHTC